MMDAWREDWNLTELALALLDDFTREVIENDIANAEAQMMAALDWLHERRQAQSRPRRSVAGMGKAAAILRRHMAGKPLLRGEETPERLARYLGANGIRGEVAREIVAARCPQAGHAEVRAALDSRASHMDWARSDADAAARMGWQPGGPRVACPWTAHSEDDRAPATQVYEHGGRIYLKCWKCGAHGSATDAYEHRI